MHAIKNLIIKVFLSKSLINVHIWIYREELVDESRYCDLPLLEYLESLPITCNVHQQEIVKHLSNDGSLFQSPSATAFAFMATGNIQCIRYLESLVQSCPNGGGMTV